MENNISINNNECRICFEEESENNKLIHPCLCSGTSKYIHISCLNEWRYSNVNRSSFYKCSECNYKYKFKYLYPNENNNKIKLHSFILMSLVYFPAILTTLIVSSSDQYNNYAILNNLYYNTSNYTKFKEYVTSQEYISLYWVIILNYVLYIQHVLFFLLFNLYVMYHINSENKYRYVSFHKLKYIFQILGCFKFIITYRIFCSWNQYSNLICLLIVFPVLEGVNYCINIKNHNITIKRLDEENINYVLNYDENSVETENVSHIDNVMYLLDITE